MEPGIESETLRRPRPNQLQREADEDQAKGGSSPQAKKDLAE